MTTRILMAAFAIVLLVAAPATATDMLVSDTAMLSACWEAQTGQRGIDVFIESAEGPMAVLFASLEPAPPGGLPPSFFDVMMPLDVSGSARFSSHVLNTVVFQLDQSVWFTAVFIDGSTIYRTESVSLMLGGASAEMLDFDWAPNPKKFTGKGFDLVFGSKDLPFGGYQLLAGEKIGEQWAARGVHISAVNRQPGHPDLAILFDSANPTGGDTDLVTPGYGPDNLVPEGMLLIIAENDFDGDGDGRVDDPDDEYAGGVMTFDFDQPVIVCAVKLVDVDNQQLNELRFYDNKRMRQRLPVPAKADNAATRLNMAAMPTRRLEIDLGGSGGLAYLAVFPCRAIVDFDWATYGAPMGMSAGEVITDQLMGLGIAIDAVAKTPGLPNKAILFDTGNPTGGDDDLVTPGYGIGNVAPLRHVLIIAENDWDGDSDGLVDDPDDAEQGGVLTLNFASERSLATAKLLDIEIPESTWIELFDSSNAMIGWIPVLALGDNSLIEVPLFTQGVRRFEVHFGGSGGLAGLEFCPDP